MTEMLEIARKLSVNIPHLRVDFLVCNGKLYSGELTFFSAGGFWNVRPQEWDDIIGEYIKSPDKKHKGR